jgi:hypothetical protein
MDPPDPDPAVEPPPMEGKKRDLTSEQRRNIVNMLLLAVKPGDAEMNLQRGAIKSCADTYNVNRFTIRKVWQRALENFRNPDIRAFISSPQKKAEMVDHSSGFATTFAKLSTTFHSIREGPSDRLLQRWIFPRVQCSG